MNDLSDEEKQLRDRLGIEIPEPPALEGLLEITVRQASVQTGARDLLTLAISSFFAFLLAFCAPIVAASAARKGRRFTSTENTKKFRANSD
ncbi:hypothetical protein [Teredinibacter purpureus]|uniref:hypothetical protein n=1 Tax=Teredinibacter purpureus TaxID=2731756 RepID=UPI0005F7C694|nr:hypothetical protein [Teredinibacter purpureus]